MHVGKKKQTNSGPKLYEQFMETHNCPINHEGLAGSIWKLLVWWIAL